MHNLELGLSDLNLDLENRGSLFIDFINFDDVNAMNKMLQEVVCLVLFFTMNEQILFLRDYQFTLMILFHNSIKFLLKLTRFYIDSYWFFNLLCYVIIAYLIINSYVWLCVHLCC